MDTTNLDTSQHATQSTNLTKLQNLQKNVLFLARLDKQDTLCAYGLLGYRIANEDRASFFNQALYMASQILKASPQDKDMRNCFANMISIWYDHGRHCWTLERSAAIRVLLKVFDVQELYNQQNLDDQPSENVRPFLDTLKLQSWTRQLLAASLILAIPFVLGYMILTKMFGFKDKRTMDLHESIAISRLGRCLHETFGANPELETESCLIRLSFEIRASWKYLNGFGFSSWNVQTKQLFSALTTLSRIKGGQLPDCEEEEIYQYDEDSIAWMLAH